ncbi:unnamed protein product [Penicillium salamii]|uniref:Zn(2)-C6 fungal-type domain-containing protein n=1 Tax=Penicillium salamii TaxID=1612424 RepID=A0A9W4JTN0_9EURO|nr:unnamed protein product [Penicillium salamii]CAG8277237.1 unnamed protein product [Penicillium salamii]CAG8294855.1 unnamed protein product [Penicillium salamii]CAG8378099.1 unnamed protein product [Penicillium salamii]CAG8400673.1 unnamed protein product [Penicillium salamii]
MMVGVPKSKGCQTCIQRRVKCDLSRPKCSQCHRYGTDCPGYIRSHKFMDEGPQLRTRYAKTGKPSESIDECIAPALVARSMGKQQPVIFGDFVMAAFTRWFGLNKYRVHVPWTGYIAQHSGKSPAFDAAVYSMNLVFMGHTHDDNKLQQSSREMYSKALRLFGDTIRTEAAMKSRDSVSITIVLSLFEAYSRTNPDSWARHASGTAVLMAHRGPAAHLTGFDRCLYLSFRSFIVAEAFVNDKKCIFELPEWQAHIHQVRSEDMTDPRVDGPIALFIDLQDRIFVEVVKIPGMLFRSRRLQRESQPGDAANQVLEQVLQCSKTISTLSAHLRLAAAVQKYNWCKPEDRGSVESNDKAQFIGPIPSTFPQQFANSVLHGCDICLFLLGLLQDHLQGYCHVGIASGASDGTQTAPADRLPFRIVSKLRSSSGNAMPSSVISALHKDLPSPDKWLDLVAASMGLEAFDIITHTTKSHQTT